MQVFDTDEEGLELANGTEFGLAACVVSGSRTRAEAFTKHLVAGQSFKDITARLAFKGINKTIAAQRVIACGPVQ